MTPFMAVITILAVYRLTRLVTADRIMDRFRDWCQGRSNFIAYLSTCDWCLSIWVAPPVTAAAIYWGHYRVVMLVLLALSASALTGLLATVEAKMSKESA